MNTFYSAQNSGGEEYTVEDAAFETGVSIEEATEAWEQAEQDAEDND